MLWATVGVLLVLLLVTAIALVYTCVALQRKNKQRYTSGMHAPYNINNMSTCNSTQEESYPMDSHTGGKGSVAVPVPSTEVNPAYDAVKYTQGEDTYETVH